MAANPGCGFVFTARCPVQVLLWLISIVIGLVSLGTVLAHFVRLRKFKPADRASVSIILPVTGAAESFEALLDALNAQTLRPMRLVVSVESREDPAYARVCALRYKAQFPVVLVVAGLAARQAQKCRNQQAALDAIDANTQVIVLMDADIQPDPLWLGRLVAPVAAGRYDIMGGHRWQQVVRPCWGAHLVTAVDRAITLLPRIKSGFARVLWGGSIALSVEAARRVDLRGMWDRVLSDDLALARRAARLGLRMGTRGSLMVPSPNGQALGAAWHFARRQYQMCWIYRPVLWAIGLVSVGFRLAGWGAALWMELQTAEDLALPVLMLLGGLKPYLIGELARRLGLPDPWRVRVAQVALGLLQPLADLFHLSIIVAACPARRVRWGHVTYRVRGPDDILVGAREPFPRG